MSWIIPACPLRAYTTHMSSSAKGIGIAWASCFKVRAMLRLLIIVPTNQTVLPLVLPAFNHKAKVPICNLVGHNYHSHCNNHLQIGSLGTCRTVSVCVGVCWSVSMREYCCFYTRNDGFTLNVTAQCLTQLSELSNSIFALCSLLFYISSHIKARHFSHIFRLILLDDHCHQVWMIMMVLCKVASTWTPESSISRQNITLLWDNQYYSFQPSVVLIL